MKQLKADDVSLSEVHKTVETTGKTGWRKIFSFLGPAYLVSVGYMDPGNWATDIAGGSRFGYQLIWVLLMSNLMALLLQGLSARLGIVRGRDLAQANREAYPKLINFFLYILAEIAIAATDLAEVLGMAIGIQLLTGLPLIWGVSITILDTFLLLYLQRLGMRKMEAFILALVIIVALCFLLQIIMASPDPVEVASGLVPSELSGNALFIAIGIIGATVMPHNLYLHSALVQTRKIEHTEEGIRRAIRFNRIDSTIALNIAFLVNAAILILAATVFYKTGNQDVAEIKEAHRLLPSFLGDLAPILFAVALIAAGQSSTVTGTLAGQIVMEGYLRLRISPLLRRLLTRLLAIIPAFLIILIYGEDEVDAMLVMSQVILSLQLGYAILPLISFVSDKRTMGKFAIGPVTRILAWVIAAVLVFLNLKMLSSELEPVMSNAGFVEKMLIYLCAAALGGLLIYIVLHPYFGKKKKDQKVLVHDHSKPATKITTRSFKRIAVALDFSGNDDTVLSYARSQAGNDAEYFIVHIVESVQARLIGKDSRDYETLEDQKLLNKYIEQLRASGVQATGALGYKRRVKSITGMVKEFDADLLVMGAHGHRGLGDFIFGSTIDKVRHRLKIPVLVVTTD